jgi:Hedgehog amino-terminal signalling domain
MKQAHLIALHWSSFILVLGVHASTAIAADDLLERQKVPNKAEKDVVGESMVTIVRGSVAFMALVRNDNPDIVFKDEESFGQPDHYMTKRLRDKVDVLADKVKTEWPGRKLRVIEAWDEQDEHTAHSTHYEGRAVDISVSDRDGAKLGRLGRLAVEAGFDWVYFENLAHVHASVKRD